MPPIEDMTPEEIAEMMEALRQELIRRQNLALFQQRGTEMQEEFRSAGMIPVPEEGPWERPVEVVKAYGLGDVVTIDGHRRQATAGMIVCRPDCNEHWTDALDEEDPETPDAA